MERNKILHSAISKYGVWPQVDMMTEECSELIQALNKMKRIVDAYKHPTLRNIPKPNFHSSLKYTLAYYDVCAEIADVQNVLDQMKIIFNPESVELSQERKLNRLKDRINK